MNHQTIKPSNQLATIDIILSVIDNYGDIGFACELIAAWRRDIGGDTLFIVWTNRVREVTSFVEKNRHLLGEVDIKDKDDFGDDRLSDITLALFHADIPDISGFESGSLVFRIDYLSFDRTWTIHHLKEHISSTPSRQIIEVIPSPILESGGLLYPYNTSITRNMLASCYNLDASKEWVVVFAYPSTIESIITFDNVDSCTQVLIFGAKQEFSHKNIIKMPWVDITTWHAFIDESSWTLVRGEVSAVGSLMRDKLAFWDMYKMIGGLNHEQSGDYLDLIHANGEHRDIHARLNGQQIGGICWSELEQCILKNGISQIQDRERTKNLITEIKKCIDSHEFSI